jgi:hypothetical protein
MESLPVPSVQAMVAATGGADVPSRYLRPEAAADAVAVAGEDQIPIIDYQRLLLDHGEESARLHRVCQDWGFFQVCCHTSPSFTIHTCLCYLLYIGTSVAMSMFCQSNQLRCNPIGDTFS